MNKATFVADYVVSQGIDVLAITERLLGTDTDQITINQLVPGGYEFNHIPRKVADAVVVLAYCTNGDRLLR